MPNLLNGLVLPWCRVVPSVVVYILWIETLLYWAHPVLLLTDLDADVSDADHLAKRLKSLAAPSQVPQNEEEQEIHQPHSSSSARSAAAPAPAPARDADLESDDDPTRPNSPEPFDDDLTRPNSPDTQGTPP